MVKSKELKAYSRTNNALAGCLLLCSLCLSGWKMQGEEHRLRLEIRGVRNSKGMLLLSVFNKREGFPGDEHKAMRVVSVPAQQGRVQLTVDKLPAGEYAIALLHDENGNGELDTNLVGYPKEGYGASNNQLPAFRAPSFEESAFRLPVQDEALEILIRY